jgi:hypothetical protein
MAWAGQELGLDFFAGCSGAFGETGFPVVTLAHGRVCEAEHVHFYVDLVTGFLHPGVGRVFARRTVFFPGFAFLV